MGDRRLGRDRTFWREEEQTEPKTGEEWQRGLPILDKVEPSEWIECGARVGRRIPKECRAPYRNSIVNICKEQEKQARMGNPTEMRRIEKLLILTQAMLHRIPKGEITTNNAKKTKPIFSIKIPSLGELGLKETGKWS